MIAQNLLTRGGRHFSYACGYLIDNSPFCFYTLATCPSDLIYSKKIHGGLAFVPMSDNMEIWYGSAHLGYRRRELNLSWETRHPAPQVLHQLASDIVRQVNRFTLRRTSRRECNVIHRTVSARTGKRLE